MSVTRISSFDITAYPQDTVFVLDTNVLYYVHSGYYLPNSNESIDYSNVIQIILSHGYSIKVSALSIQELLYGVENKEYQLYCQSNGKNQKSYTKKHFRQDQAQRLAVKRKLKTILSELAMYKLEDGVLLFSVLEQFTDTFEAHEMDPMDYTLAHNYDAAKTVFVSADKDFQSLTSIQVLTS